MGLNNPGTVFRTGAITVGHLATFAGPNAIQDGGAVPGGGAPGGASGTVQYNNSSAFGGMSGTSWDDTNRSLTLTGATVTTSKPVFNLSQTWNAGGVTFSGIKLNVTNTASAAASLLLDLQVGGNSIFAVGESISDQNNTAFSIAGVRNTGFYQNGTNAWMFSAGGSPTVLIGSTGTTTAVGVANGAAVSFCAGSDPQNTCDLFVRRDAANIFAQRNGSNAQAFRIYNTFTDASNYERGGFDWIATANTLRIRSENLGTGTNRIIAIDGFTKAGAAAVGDLPTGGWGLIHDSSGATTKLCYNDAGTLRTVALT